MLGDCGQRSCLVLCLFMQGQTATKPLVVCEAKGLIESVSPQVIPANARSGEGQTLVLLERNLKETPGSPKGGQRTRVGRHLRVQWSSVQSSCLSTWDFNFQWVVKSTQQIAKIFSEKQNGKVHCTSKGKYRFLELLFQCRMCVHVCVCAGL